ncbi:MAG: HAD hydrolase-like protein [Anaerotignaceae bacterium]
MEKLDYSVILFDLDGTVIDSMKGILNAMNYSFVKMGLGEITEQELLPFIGPPIVNTLQQHFGMDLETANTTISYYHEYYKVEGWKECSLYSGMGQLFESLRAKGKKLALATNKPNYYARQILKHHNVDQYFHYIGGTDVEKGIVNKTLVIEDCLSVLDITDKRNAVMVGDRHFDVEGAFGAGIKTIGVTYGYGDREELTHCGALIVVDTAQEVNQLF